MQPYLSLSSFRHTQLLPKWVAWGLSSTCFFGLKLPPVPHSIPPSLYTPNHQMQFKSDLVYIAFPNILSKSSEPLYNLHNEVTLTIMNQVLLILSHPLTWTSASLLSSILPVFPEVSRALHMDSVAFPIALPSSPKHLLGTAAPTTARVLEPLPCQSCTVFCGKL